MLKNGGFIMKKVLKGKFMLFSGIIGVMLLGFNTRAMAATWYDVKVYDTSGNHTLTAVASDESGYYNVDEVLRDSNRAGYDGTTYYKACAFSSSTTAVRVRFRNHIFNPNYSSNMLGDGKTNSYQNVYEAQMALSYLGWNSWSNIDGFWGTNTKNAVKSFQAASALTSDGIVGARSWIKLASDGARSGSYLMSSSSYTGKTEISYENNWDKVDSIIKSNSYNKDASVKNLISSGFEVRYNTWNRTR
jgi:peptidoglycan hydrolase-like protein with peptidoglycan-binding domain